MPYYNSEDLLPAGDQGLGIRLRRLIDLFYEGVPTFVRRFALNESQVYRVCKGATNPSADYLGRFSTAGFNIHWLVTGEGAFNAPNDAGTRLFEAWKAHQYKNRREFQ